jgi:hypothetical protein
MPDASLNEASLKEVAAHLGTAILNQYCTEKSINCTGIAFFFMMNILDSSAIQLLLQQTRIAKRKKKMLALSADGEMKFCGL